MPILSLIGGARGSRIIGRTLSKVTGGEVASDSTYYYRVFKSNGTFSVADAPLLCDYLVIGGGGAGEGGGGGGGAGGVISGSALLAQGNYNAVIGGGGFYYGSGTNSSFNSLIANGGGFGSTSGGSGGGAKRFGSAASAGIGTPGQGNNGGKPRGQVWAGGGGGGGGAGAVGGSTTNTNGGNGGDGTTAYAEWLTAIRPVFPPAGDFNWNSRTSSGYIAGGGGGGSYEGGYFANAGQGGGGFGGTTLFPNHILYDGTENTGSGSGAGAMNHDYNQYNVFASGKGGAGLVVVRYRKSDGL